MAIVQTGYFLLYLLAMVAPRAVNALKQDCIQIGVRRKLAVPPKTRPETRPYCMNEDAKTKKAPPKSNPGEIPRPARDWLLILLTGSAGSIDAATFLKSHVFTANMTGNTVILGLGLARVQSVSVANTLFALCGFCFGAGMAALIVQPLFTKRGWSHKVNQALSVAAFLLLAGGISASIPGQYAIPATIAAVAAAMGIQSASAQHLAVAGISTNVITSTLTTAVIRAVNVLFFSHPPATKVEGP